LTSLPTLNLTSYNGAIDQGIIRKPVVRECVALGSFSYGAIETDRASGRTIFSSTNNDTIEWEVYGTGKTRNWVQFDSSSDNLGWILISLEAR
jgi:hypothetical protein